MSIHSYTVTFYNESQTSSLPTNPFGRSARSSKAIFQMRNLASFQLPKLSAEDYLHFTFPLQHFLLFIYNIILAIYTPPQIVMPDYGKLVPGSSSIQARK